MIICIIVSVNNHRSVVQVIVISEGHWLFEFLISFIFLWTTFIVDGPLLWTCSIKVTVISLLLLRNYSRYSQLLLSNDIIKVTYLTEMSHLWRVGTADGRVLLSRHPITYACTLLWCLARPSVMIYLDTALLRPGKPFLVNLIFSLILHINDALDSVAIKRIRDLAFYFKTILMQVSL